MTRGLRSAALTAMALRAIWLLPPWWTPYGFAVGDWLCSAGNSGNTGGPLGGDPLPILFMGRYPVRGDHIESP